MDLYSSMNFSYNVFQGWKEARVIQCLPSKCKVLSSTSSTWGEKKQKQKPE
jgi:hypothetical protein